MRTAIVVRKGGHDVSATAATRGASVNAMSVDVEDWFQVSAFEGHVNRADWDGLPHRVERNVERLLDIFAAHGVHATFFTLGWVAERYPGMVRRIVAEGHELGSHGWCHIRATQQQPDQFRADVLRTKHLLEDTAGVAVAGYRAASYSIGETNLWALEVLAETGHRYSSSIYRIRHDLYGMPSAPRFAFAPIPEADFIEIPVTTFVLRGHKLPCGGGGFFRLFPYRFSRWAMRQVNEVDGQSCVFYFHPWEIDVDQPRQRGVGLKAQFRHYLNLGRMEQRLGRLLKDFRWNRMDEVFLGHTSGHSDARRPAS
jgi:polysaccharide deacetylase family protein (PEP-CTERM system associated)